MKGKGGREREVGEEVSLDEVVLLVQAYFLSHHSLPGWYLLLPAPAPPFGAGAGRRMRSQRLEKERERQKARERRRRVDFERQQRDSEIARTSSRESSLDRSGMLACFLFMYAWIDCTLQ
jgi:hypothetical protein